MKEYMIMKKTHFFSRLPVILPNRIMYAGYTLLSFFSFHVGKKVREAHFRENGEKNIDSRIFSTGRYIENQSLWKNVKFGSGKKSSMEYSGCTIIAVYNLLLSLGDKDRNILKIIDAFEKRGLALKGDFGIAPYYAYRYLKINGYKARYITSKNRNVIDKFGNSFDGFILTFYWDKYNIFNKLHTINISKENGKFVAHNCYHKDSNGKFGAIGPYDSLSDAVKAPGENTLPLVIIGVNNK